MSSLLVFLLFGLTVIDADLAMQKKQEVKSLLELANHDATFAVDQVLKTEGIMELVESEAMDRLAQRMWKNGGYTRQGNAFVPSSTSVTTDPLLFVCQYVDFQHWRKDLTLSLRFAGNALTVEDRRIGPVDWPSGGHVRIEVATETGEVLRLAPKQMVGPSLIIVAYVHERSLTPLLPAHSFPVASIEELKW